jgi:hypothetical protein
VFDELGWGLGELAAIAADAAADDVERLVLPSFREWLDMIERALATLESDATVVAFALDLLDEVEVLGADHAMDAHPAGLGVVRSSESNEAPPLRSLRHRPS